MRGKNTTVQYTPKSHAEWRFVPTSGHRRKSGVSYQDVGVFIDYGEVLLLKPIGPMLRSHGRLIVPVAEGKIEIVEDDWIEWDKSNSAVESIFDIRRIIREYEAE